ncbi:MAG TPA: CFI-box-CTERM domain-containing protein, partial [Nitrososphaera sp.]
FDWNLQYVSQVPLVHMEVEFPKVIENLQSNGYSGTVNGQGLAPGDVLIDDYSFPDRRVVHFVLNNARLTSIAESAEGASMDFVLVPVTTPKFPLDLFSTTERFLWQVSWGPEVIETGVQTTFAMNIQDPAIGDLVRNSSFDFVVTKDGREVHSQHLTSGQGTFAHQYTFAEPGTYRIAAQNINGGGESAQLDIVVLQGTKLAEQPQQPSGCLIATAAFGSELTPQVQFLRGFRDNYVMQSASGSAFMNTFNAVYYSFSPQVADYERDQPWLQATVKAAIYPLFGILLASEKAFSASGGGEAGAVLAGAIASSLIGAVYVSPAAAAVAIAGKRRVGTNILIIASLATAASLAATAVALQAGSFLALQLAASAFVISAAGTTALAVARLAKSALTR